MAKIHFTFTGTLGCGRQSVPAARIHWGDLQAFLAADGDPCGPCERAALAAVALLKRCAGWAVLTGSVAWPLMERGYLANHHNDASGPAFELTERGRTFLAWFRENIRTEYVREKTGRMIPCPGEAHGNVHIDNCGMCAPRWGEIEELAPVDLERARAERLDVPVPSLTREQYTTMEAVVARGEARHVSVTRRKSFGTSSYFVYRWA